MRNGFLLFFSYTSSGFCYCLVLGDTTLREDFAIT